jgi:hypothetical protein
VVGAVIPNNPDELEIRRLRFKLDSAGETEESPITPDERTALSEGKAWLATFGLVEYDDVFKKRHWTQFCDWSQFKPGIQYSAQGCSEYNNVDGE